MSRSTHRGPRKKVEAAVQDERTLLLHHEKEGKEMKRGDAGEPSPTKGDLEERNTESRTSREGESP